MELTPRLTPWVQKLVFTGRSFYTIDVLSGGIITAQRDVWDAIQDNNHLSLEGLAYLVRQLTNGQAWLSLCKVLWLCTFFRSEELTRQSPQNWSPQSIYNSLFCRPARSLTRQSMWF